MLITDQGMNILSASKIGRRRISRLRLKGLDYLIVKNKPTIFGIFYFYSLWISSLPCVALNLNVENLPEIIPQFEIFIKQLDGSHTVHDVSSNRTIDSIKSELSWAFRQSSNVNLYFQNKKLAGCQTIKSYNIEKYNVLEVQLSLLGGTKNWESSLLGYKRNMMDDDESNECSPLPEANPLPPKRRRLNNSNVYVVTNPNCTCTLGKNPKEEVSTDDEHDASCPCYDSSVEESDCVDVSMKENDELKSSNENIFLDSSEDSFENCSDDSSDEKSSSIEEMDEMEPWKESSNSEIDGLFLGSDTDDSTTNDDVLPGLFLLWNFF